MGDFSDLFDGVTLGSSWTEVDPLNDCTVSVAAGFAVLTVPTGIGHDLLNATRHALRIMRAANDLDFRAETNIPSAAPSSEAQMFGILVEQDARNWIRWGVQYSGGSKRMACVQTTDALSTTVYSVGFSSGIAAFAVKRTGNSWQVYTSADGTNFASVATFSKTMVVNQLGLFAGNAVNNPAYAPSAAYFYLDEQSAVVRTGEAAVTTPTAGTLSVAPVATALRNLTGYLVLLIVGDPGALTFGESVLRDELIAAGATVTVVTGSDGGTAANAAITGKHLFIVSDSVPVGFGSTLASSTVPGINCQPVIWPAHQYSSTSSSGDPAASTEYGLLNGIGTQLAML